MTKRLNQFLKWQRNTGAYGNVKKETAEFVYYEDLAGTKSKKAINSLIKELVKKKYWNNKKKEWYSKAY